MAGSSTDKFFEDLQEIVTCPICTDILKDPSILPCLHTFCSSCLHSLPQDEQRSTPCPVCRCLFKVKNIKKDFKTASLVLVFHQQEELRNQKKKLCVLCEHHAVAQYCRKCERLLCESCCTGHLKLTSCSLHDAVTWEMHVEFMQGEIEAMCSKVDKAMDVTVMALQNATSSYQQKQEEALTKIDIFEGIILKAAKDHFQSQRCHVKTQTASVYSKVHNSYSHHLKRLQTFKNRLQLLKDMDHCDLVDVFQKRMSHNNSLANDFKQFNYKPPKIDLVFENEDSNALAFDVSKAFQVTCKEQHFFSNVPSNGVWTNCRQAFCVNMFYTIHEIVHAMVVLGNNTICCLTSNKLYLFEIGTSPLSCVLISDVVKEATGMAVTSNQTLLISSSCTGLTEFTVIGQHRHIIAEGSFHDVAYHTNTRTAFAIREQADKVTICTYQRCDGGFRAKCVLENSELTVERGKFTCGVTKQYLFICCFHELCCDTQRSIYQFDLNGVYLQAFGHCGTSPGQLYYPRLCNLTDDCLVIADSWNHRLQVLNPLDRSEYFHVVKVQGDSLQYPWAVCKDESDNLYVAGGATPYNVYKCSLVAKSDAATTSK